MDGVDSREERPPWDNDRIMVCEPARKAEVYCFFKKEGTEKGSVSGPSRESWEGRSVLTGSQISLREWQ